MPKAPDPVASPADRRPPRTGDADVITAVAIVLIIVSVTARALIARRGYLSYDDFPLISMAELKPLGPDYLFGLFNNHLMPAGHLVTWLTNELGGFSYGPYLALLVAGQALVAITFYRLLRLMLAPGWLLIVPLAIFLFSPLTLEASSWWAVGVNMLPMQLAMILAVGAQVKYIRTRRRLHLVTLGLSILLGLLFFEKAILAVALVFLVTLFLYAPGGPITAVVQTIRRWWPSWAVLTGISLVFLAFYLSRSTSSLRRPSSVDEVITFVVQMFGHTLLPGMAGGPWAWLGAGDGAPITAPSPVARWIALVVVLAFVAFTVWQRGWAAARAWFLLLSYAAIVAGLLGATRLGSIYSGVAGAVPRYLADVAVVVAIAAGAALCGLRAVEAVTESGPRTAGAATASGPRTAGAVTESGPRTAGAAAGSGPAAPRTVIPRRIASPVLAAGIALFVASAAVSTIGFGDAWAVKQGRDYLANARAGLEAAPAGTVFMDQAVPEGVVGRLSGPYNMQSRFFAPMEDGPDFVTKARELSVFDEEGHVRPAWVRGPRSLPGPRSGCGYQLAGSKVRITMEGSVPDYWHVLRIAYLARSDTSGMARLGNGIAVPFDVHQGLNAVFLLVNGGGSTVELTVADRNASVCTDEVLVGDIVPAPAG
ncbi:hypothetical protein [Actinoplanes sp. NPDC023714]|uniref:hypothetical protein n=1 Tax=Actinoplanes sp. NPDC023714 TaxID=3154322 RepID=UPI0033D736A2